MGSWKGRVSSEVEVLTSATFKSVQTASVLSTDRLFCCVADSMNEPVVPIERCVAAQCGSPASKSGHAFAGSPRKRLPEEYRISRVALLHTCRRSCNTHQTCHAVQEIQSETTCPYSIYARAGTASSFPPAVRCNASLASLSIAFQ